MRRVRSAFIVLILLNSAVFARAAQGALQPVDLRCEYRVNPLGVDSPAPRLSWKLDAVNPGARGLNQSAYQILAASREEVLSQGQGDLWDSGKVDADRSIQVAYGGKMLSSGEGVWWKVRVWDNDAKVSAWSQPAGWSMGLLNESDWQGKWIGFDGGEAKPQEFASAKWIGVENSSPGTIYFRRTFEVSKDNPVSYSPLWMVGSGAIAVTLNNGSWKTGGAKDPLYVDLTNFFRPGANVLAVTVNTSGGDPTALIGAFELNFADSSRTIYRTDDAGRVSSVKAEDWNKDGFDDSAWQAARILGPYGMSPWGDVGQGWRTVLPARLLRKEFSPPAQIKHATLYISGLGLFEAYLNGAKIGNDVLVPALSEYEKRVYYMTYDVTKLLRPGPNALGVMLGNGRFFPPRHNIPTVMRGFGYPKLRLQLEMETSDGRINRVVSDESWKLTTDGPIRANNEYDGEIYDARMELADWSKVGFNDSAWQQAQVMEGPAGVLSAQPIAPIRVTETLNPVSMHEVKPGVVVFDMGQNMVGWCRLTVSGPRGATVTLRHAERLRPNGMLYVDNLRSAEAKDTYILKGSGAETYEPRFTYHGFRYVEVKGFPGNPSLASLEGREVHDDVARASEFTTSNPLLNQIYKAVVWGTQDNYRSMPTDCPQRDERQGWLGDRSGGSLGETYLFNVAAFYAKWVRDMHDAQDAKGRISDVSPAYWPLYNDNVTWPASFILVADHLYRQYGDERVIELHYPGMRKWILHMEGYLKNDLMPRDSYGDWCVPPESPDLILTKDPARKTEATVIGTAYFYYLLRKMQRFATILEKPDDASEYSQVAERMLTAFNKTYLHDTGDQYSNGSETSSVLPLAFHMVPADDRQKVADALLQKIDLSHDHLATGLVGGQSLMQTLTEIGHPAVAYEIAAQRTYPSWGYMVTHGATTIWELWNGDTANPAMNSGNHLMLVGDLITWLYEDIAGFRPDPENPAFKHIIMRPSPVGDLTFVRASYDSPYGRITSDWKITGGRFIWLIITPPNTTATIYIPTDDAAKVREGEKSAGKSLGARFLRAEPGAAVYEIGSGSYRFESALTHKME